MRLHGFHRWVCGFACILALNLFAATPATDSGDKASADKAWSELEKALKPATPKEWQTKQPTEAEQNAYFVPQVLKSADLAHDFYTKYPQDKRAAQAKFFEMRALNNAENMGATNATARLQALEKDKMADPNASEGERLQIRFNELQRKAEAKGEFGTPAFNDVMIEGVNELLKDFPKRPDLWKVLLEMANLSAPDKARPVLKEIIEGNVPAQLKEEAKNTLTKLDLIGKPLDIKFKAVDGREVDLKNMKGKVVLLDFWATWCMPCVGEIPHVKEAYSQLHDKGFEVVGISLDEDKSKLTKFVADQKMEWPQYFDGKQFDNDIASKFEIHSIPAMWLIDKKGNLSTINARVDLKGQVEKLLAEK